MLSYIKRKGKVWGILVCLWVFLDFYLGFLCASALYFQDMVYLNLLLFGAAAVWAVTDYRRYRRLRRWTDGQEDFTEEEQRRLLGEEVYAYVKDWEEEKKEEQFQERQKLEELSDYVAAWTHEAKLPLASLKLMNSRSEDENLRESMGTCIARMEVLLQNVLAGSKLQHPENDVRFEKVNLEAAIRESVKNQSYFLVRSRFEILIECGKTAVYSDKRWLVYLLDQLVGNAAKYCSGSPRLVFRAEKEKDGAVLLTVEDNGIGISDKDLPYIFQKGYVGSRHRKGDYHSTGMGLYFAGKIAGLLHMELQVFSEEGKGCRFELRFRDMADHLLLTGEGKETESEGDEADQQRQIR